MKATLVGTAKNEGPYIWEWVAYHRAMGFTDIVLYENGSDDGTRKVLRELNRIGAISFYRNETPPRNYQIRAYKRAAETAAFQEADWAMALDLDEFLVIKTGDGTIKDYIEAVPPCDAILINWRIFGCGGHALPNAMLTTERFTRAEETIEVADNMRAIKTLFRPSSFSRPGVHQPRGFKREGEEPVYVNGSGLKEGEFERMNWRASDPKRFELAQINHYAVRDAGSFLLKTMRGSAHQENRKVGRRYWNVLNENAVEERSTAPYLERTRAEMARLDAETKGLMSEYTAFSLARRLNKIEATLADEEHRKEFLFFLGR